MPALSGRKEKKKKKTQNYMVVKYNLKANLCDIFGGYSVIVSSV